MNLTHRELLELGKLCDGLVDGTLTEAQHHTLSAWLGSSGAARQFYVRTMALSADLHSYASEMLADSPDVMLEAVERRESSAWKWLAPFALAASLVFGFWVVGRNGPGPDVPAERDEFVARLTASKDCRWETGTNSLDLGDFLRRGQSVELASGFAEITFDSGAMVLLEGPSLVELSSAWEISLHRGTLKASVPAQAIGFRVSNPAVEIVDLGTSFTMIADGNGVAEVLVLDGAVEAEPHDELDHEAVVLHKNESLRFTATGISEISDSESKFARFEHPPSLERFAPPPNYVHWSFDTPEAGRFPSTAVGLPPLPHPAVIRDEAALDLPSIQVKGHWHGALHFNGRHYAMAPFPGLSDNGARTVAFWVKVPSDTQLSEAYAMAAWLPSNPELQFHPIHIGWNRNPSEGAVGVLRADYARGFALGSTPLRSGRWHHIAVVFVPGPEADTPLQVKLYLDGRFEGEGRPSPPGKRIDSTKSPDDYTRQTRDVLWLGCRLGSDGPRANRFRGAMDELFVIDRELMPSEIVQLMTRNRIDPEQAVAAAAPTGFQRHRILF